MTKFILLTALILAAAALIQAQLSGTVGPLTSYKAKATKKTCDITKYGAVADGKTDISTALANAWADCKVGGLVYVPPGTFALSTWVSLKDGSASAFQLDGIIVRNSDSGGTMLSFTSCNDFEFFSGSSKGAFQGYGYKLLQNGNYGPRFLRFTGIENFSVHGFALVDSASYYIVYDSCSNGEVYNIIIRGISTIGATDGIDVWGTNMWIHDVEVTNGDECVTVKSPSKNFRIESIYCNLSGGTAIGSLGVGTSISDISYYHLYMNQADACFVKTNNGDGTVSNIVWDTVTLHGSTFGVVLDEDWGASRGSTGVQLSNLTFTNWHGVTGSNSRPAIRLQCDPNVPCYDIKLENVNIWTESGDYITTSCQNVYGSGYCIKNDDTSKLATYTSVGTVTAKPNYATSYMPNDLASAFPSTKSFTIPPVPTSFYPGATPFSKLLSLSAAGGLAKRSLPTPI